MSEHLTPLDATFLELEEADESAHMHTGVIMVHGEAVVSLSCLSPDSVRLEGSEPGVLAGRTFVVKDLFAVAGHTSSFGHPRWRETHDPSVDVRL
jgi:Asp-tRNA(Asn)/Glu-tRNA(Gln) amidotransferase A subunit family amidase